MCKNSNSYVVKTGGRPHSETLIVLTFVPCLQYLSVQIREPSSPYLIFPLVRYSCFQ